MKKNSVTTSSFANCFLTSTSNVYNCTVESESQDKNALVFLTKTVSEVNGVSEVSVTWTNVLQNDQQIIRLAELTFVDAYDLLYSNSWSFKIEVGEEDLPDQGLYTVDTNSGSSFYAANCYHENKILSCSFSSSTPDAGKLLVISTRKSKGSVTWKNLVKEKKMPFNTDLTFVESFGLFFADKWHFMIKATSTKAKPVNSVVIVDILLNNKETTATCEIISCTSTSTKTLNISC